MINSPNSPELENGNPELVAEVATLRAVTKATVHYFQYVPNGNTPNSCESGYAK